MSQNIYEVKELESLRKIMKNNVTVILLVTASTNDKKIKCDLRKIIKSKSKKYPMIMFVYLELNESMNKTGLNILDDPRDSYPQLFHIRDQSHITLRIKNACVDSVLESFDEMNELYNEELREYNKKIKKKNEKISSLDASLEHKKNKEKLQEIQRLRENNNLRIIREIAKRKSMEDQNI